jgi:hypothetical protein
MPRTIQGIQDQIDAKYAIISEMNDHDSFCELADQFLESEYTKYYDSIFELREALIKLSKSIHK